MSYSSAVQSLAVIDWAKAQTGLVTPPNLVTASRGQRDASAYPPPAAALKAYMVEDNAIIRDNLTDTLKELVNVDVIGYAATERTACGWLARHTCDWQLLIVDLFLLEGSGLGVIRQCVRHNPEQRVVVLSNYATDDMRSRCMACGADAVFDKSTELDQFFSYCART